MPADFVRSSRLFPGAPYAYAAAAPGTGVVAAAFGDHDAPSTLLGVAALGYEGQLVEIEAVAFVLPS
jgi:hypothetical protein